MVCLTNIAPNLTTFGSVSKCIQQLLGLCCAHVRRARSCTGYQSSHLATPPQDRPCLLFSTNKHGRHRHVSSLDWGGRQQASAESTYRLRPLMWRAFDMCCGTIRDVAGCSEAKKGTVTTTAFQCCTYAHKRTACIRSMAALEENSNGRDARPHRPISLLAGGPVCRRTSSR